MAEAIGKVLVLVAALAATGFFLFLLTFGVAGMSNDAMWGAFFVTLALWAATGAFWGIDFW